MDKCALIYARIFAGIAQLVEQLICNQQVVGSNPTAGSLVNRGLTSNIRRSAWTLLGRFSYSKAPKTTYFWVAYPPNSVVQPFFTVHFVHSFIENPLGIWMNELQWLGRENDSQPSSGGGLVRTERD